MNRLIIPKHNWLKASRKQLKAIVIGTATLLRIVRHYTHRQQNFLVNSKCFLSSVITELCVLTYDYECNRVFQHRSSLHEAVPTA